MTRKRTPSYPGMLNEPIFTNSKARFADERILGAIEGKLELLFEHYQIAPNDRHRWQKLALALAFDHVPGFTLERGSRPTRGRHKTWSIAESRKLVDAVDAINKERKLGIKDAVRILRQRSPSEWSGAGLETRYHECKKRLDSYDDLRARARRSPSGSLAVIAALISLRDYE
jgi:hypothetical protein